MAGKLDSTQTRSFAVGIPEQEHGILINGSASSKRIVNIYLYPVWIQGPA